MRIKIIFSKGTKIELPIDYNRFIQAFIYSYLNRELAEKLHNDGFKYEKRQFKLFTFSRILGKYKLNNDKITFIPPVNLIVASAIADILQDIAKSMIRIRSAHLDSNEIEIEGVEVYKKIDFGKEAVIYTLSPITAYSTLNKSDGAKKTYYYSPYEKEFSENLKNNLVKKYIVINGKQPENTDFKIEPVDKSIKECVLKYKGTVIKGWLGKFKMSGNPELIKVGYDCGFGSKNSQGFGCVEVV